MHPPRKDQRGYMMVATIFVVMVFAVAFLVRQAGSNIAAVGDRYTRTQTSLALIQKTLVQFGATYGRLPCPANPALDSSTVNAGYPNQNAVVGTAVITCAYPDGIVPWKALGLNVKDVTDEWGRMISYRVFDGAIGLTQTGGASRVNCDTTNSGRPETYPVNGLCSSNYNTLDASFLTHKTYPLTSKIKGLVVTDFGTSVTGVAYALISHGPSGLGGYLPTGARMTMPSGTAGDYANTQSPTFYPSQSPTAFLFQAGSAPDVTPGSAGHYDDLVTYVRIEDFTKLTRLLARDWPEAPLPTFSPSTAPIPGAPPSSDPLNPRWVTSGLDSTRAFTAATVSGQTIFSGPINAQSQAACLWWPNLLTLYSASSNFRQSLSIYLEIAAVNNTNDLFPGFTIGFLSGLEAQPTTTTCGTTSFDVTATGSAGAFSVSVANTAGFHQVLTASGTAGANTVTVSDGSGVSSGMSATGTGVGGGATVASVSGNVVTLSSANTAAVSGSVTFTNMLVGMSVSGTGVGTSGAGTFATVLSISGSTITLNRANSAAISGSINFANSRLIQRDLGWGGGTLASYSNKFSMEYDTNIDTGSGGALPVATANDPARPHLAADYAGVIHGLNAESCSTTGYESPCDMPPATFSGTSVAIASVAIVAGLTTITVPTTAGIAVGKTATGTGIGAGATVTAISGTTVTLSAASTLTGSTTVTFDTTASLVSGSADIVVSTTSGIVPGMSVSGTGIGGGATVTAISGTTVTLSAASTSSGTATVTFGAISSSKFMIDGLTVFHSVRADLTPYACLSKATSTGTSGSVTLNVPNKTAMTVGMGVSGANIATGATIRSISAFGNVVTLTLAHTGTVNGTVDFSLIPDTTKTATGAAGASTIVVSDTLWLGVGMSVTGTGIGGGAEITDISGTTVKLSVSNSAAVSGAVAFAAPVPAKTATGTSGQNTIVVSNTKGVAIGMRALGDGISDGTTVTGISGTTLTLSANNTDVISGTVTLRPPQTQLKAWTLSNAGCNADSTSCAAMKNTSVTFTQDLSANEQALGTLICLDVPSPTNAFDDVYFGITTASRTSRNVGSGVNVSFRALTVANPAQP
jgi:hypothetical protein